MKTRHYLFVLISLLCMLPKCAHSQNSGENVIEFFSNNTILEDDPKQQTYNITIFSPDGKWKMQLNYHSDNMFGTFGNDDFDLSGSGKNYNFVRNPKNDMVFYSFTDMNVSVTDEGTLYRVKANCLASNKTRFLVEATIDAPKPKETRTDNLGYARVERNDFYGTWAIYAENDNYKLGYGVTGEDLLGTFYRADMLMPELYDKKAGKSVNVLTATSLHTKNGDNTNMKIDILGDDLVMYSLTMFNGPYNVEITGEKTIEIHGAVVQDLTEMYGCYQFGGTNNEYGVSLAIKPEVLESKRTSWTYDDFVMQYTKLITMSDQAAIDIYDINANAITTDDGLMLKADITSMAGILYHVNMYLDAGDVMPEPSETVNIDFGHVSMIDYTKGVGTVGIGAFLQDKYQMRFYLNTYELDGSFSNSDFNLDMCDMMVVGGETFVFHDGKYMKATMEKQGDRILITADMLCVNDVLYHATMYIDEMKCLEGGKYSIGLQNDHMVSILYGTGTIDNEFLLQFQDLDNVRDENEDIVGDGHCFSFYFANTGNSIGGSYGYSAGTLADDVYHTFYENRCEVRIAPVAGTLSIEPIEEVIAELDHFKVKTYIYNVEFQFVGQNNAIYEGEGDNFLVCIDEDGYLQDMDEQLTGILKQQLDEKGYRVRKVLKDGKIIIEKKDKVFDIQGRRLF